MAQQRKQIDPNLLLIGGVGVLAYFGVFKPVLEFVGLKDSAEDKAQAKTIESATKSNGWNPNYFLSIMTKPYKFLDQKSAEWAAMEIEDSWGLLNDDEERIYGIFRLMADQIELSQIANAYNRLFKKDLLTTILNGFNEKEFAVISSIVNKLPAYRLK